jgi:hypothetical protein
MGLTYTYTNSESTSAPDSPVGDFLTYTRSVWTLSGSARF